MQGIYKLSTDKKTLGEDANDVGFGRGFETRHWHTEWAINQLNQPEASSWSSWFNEIQQAYIRLSPVSAWCWPLRRAPAAPKSVAYCPSCRLCQQLSPVLAWCSNRSAYLPAHLPALPIALPVYLPPFHLSYPCFHASPIRQVWYMVAQKTLPINFCTRICIEFR